MKSRKKHLSSVLALGVLLVILFLVLLYFFFFHRDSLLFSDRLSPKVLQSQTLMESYHTNRDVVCRYKTSQDVSAELFMKAGSLFVRHDSDMATTESNVLIANGNYWIWGARGNEGTIEAIGDDTVLQKIEAILHEYKDNAVFYQSSCEETSVEEEVLTPPNDVYFSDNSEVLDLLERIRTNTP